MDLGLSVKNKFNDLLKSSAGLRVGNEYSQIIDDAHAFECRGWLVSAQNLVHLVVTVSTNPFRKTVDNICQEDKGFEINKSVGEVAKILEFLLADIEQGLLSSIENQTKALVFDDFLDHAKHYSKKKMKNEAGVISGVVFEDTIRNLSRLHKIHEAGVSLDQIIAELAKANILTQAKAKRARAAAHVRTQATHAQWEEFELSDVNSTIQFTEELISQSFT